MMPVVSVYRGANLTEDKVDDLLGPLKMAIAAPLFLPLSIFRSLYVMSINK